MAKPLVVISKCLGFARCRYNGKIIDVKWLEELKDSLFFLPVCPEMAIGLGVPRDPISLILKDGEKRLIQTASGRDLTEDMRIFSFNFLSRLRGKASGFVLKSKSPSCGVNDAPLFADTSLEKPLSYGPGLFAQMVLELFPHLPVVDEKYLEHSANRRAFLRKMVHGNS